MVCLLKGLVGDGELVLQDGRRLLAADRAAAEAYSSSSSSTAAGAAPVSVQAYCDAHGILPISPDFKLIVLANRPGHPFLGNNFFREIGDLFATFVIENLDLASETALLTSFAPSVPAPMLNQLANAFADLRAHYEAGVLGYPYSAREAVGVARHAEMFQKGGLGEAVENVLGFEAMNPKTRDFIAEVRITSLAPI